MTVWKGRGHFLELFYVVLCTAVARSDSYTHEQFYRRLLVYQNLKKIDLWCFKQLECFFMYCVSQQFDKLIWKFISSCSHSVKILFWVFVLNHLFSSLYAMCRHTQRLVLQTTLHQKYSCRLATRVLVIGGHSVLSCTKC